MSVLKSILPKCEISIQTLVRTVNLYLEFINREKHFLKQFVVHKGITAKRTKSMLAHLKGPKTTFRCRNLFTGLHIVNYPQNITFSTNSHMVKKMNFKAAKHQVTG